MKYPLDQKSFQDALGVIIEHDRTMRALLSKQDEATLFTEEITEEGELSEKELEKVLKEKKLKEMTISEIDKTPLPKLEKLVKEAEEDELKEEESSDIYRIKARVANLARGPGMSLTPQGEMLCNTFVHVLKSLYDFASTLQDKEIKRQLIALVRSHEGMPGNLIAAAGAGVRQSKKDQAKV